MKDRMLWCIAVALLSALSALAQSEQFIAVDKDVKLQVLDWGGSGRALVFLTGMGNDAHVYDGFAPKFVAKYHVYGITRRGFGASSKPAPTIANYNADRLGDDVLTIVSALKLNRPVLVGHSIAGEELSSIGSRFPEKVAGLIYLDAGDGYGFYDRVHGDWLLDMIDVKQRIDSVQAGAELGLPFTQAMLTSVSQLERDLRELNKQIALMPSPPPPPPPVALAIQAGEKKFTAIDVPILAIFAVPHNYDRAFPNDAKARTAMVAADLAHSGAQASAFEAGLPSARVVRLRNADHYVFNSNEADVLREMNSFLAKLP